jgi:hypothetical protein
MHRYLWHPGGLAVTSVHVVCNYLSFFFSLQQTRQPRRSPVDHKLELPLPVQSKMVLCEPFAAPADRTYE